MQLSRTAIGRSFGLLMAFALSGVVTGCESKKTPVPAMSATIALPTPSAKILEHCDQIAGIGVCADYTRKDELDLHRKLCDGYKGKFGDGACEGGHLVGTCALDDGEFKRYYDKTASKDWGYALEDAKKNCESELLKGKFTAAAK